MELSSKHITLYFYIPKKEHIWLYEVEPAYNKGQDIITINLRNNWQTQECKILQQIRSYLEI